MWDFMPESTNLCACVLPGCKTRVLSELVGLSQACSAMDCAWEAANLA